MKKYAVSAIAGLLMLAACGCSDRDAPGKLNVTDYFFAPKAGTHFVYKLEPNASHTVTVSKVAGTENGSRILELQERISNIPSLPGEIEFRSEYTVDPASDRVIQSRKYLGGSEDVVALQGPVSGGEPWEIKHWTTPIGNKASDPNKLGIHSCRITARVELEILDDERDCIRVVCTDEGDGSKLRRTFCKGIGYIGQEYRDDDEWEPSETLIRIKELPQGVPM